MPPPLLRTSPFPGVGETLETSLPCKAVGVSSEILPLLAFQADKSQGISAGGWLGLVKEEGRCVSKEVTRTSRSQG